MQMKFPFDKEKTLNIILASGALSKHDMDSFFRLSD